MGAEQILIVVVFVVAIISMAILVVGTKDPSLF